MTPPMITDDDRRVALQWAYTLEHPVGLAAFGADLTGTFRDRAQLLRRLVGVTPDEDISQYAP